MILLKHIINLLSEKPELAELCGIYFGQNAEDIIVLKHLSKETDQKGIYVDFGAYHPVKYSLTYLLYLCGWRGVNVDANKKSIKLFEKYREDDVNLTALISNKIEKTRYVSFAEGAYNTCNYKSINELLSRDGEEFKLVDDEFMESTTPNHIFEKYIGEKKFDYLNIDLEGFDEKILYSINFEKYRPKVITMETNIETCWNQPMKSFLEKNNYKIVSHCNETAVFLSETEYINK